MLSAERYDVAVVNYWPIMDSTDDVGELGVGLSTDATKRLLTPLLQGLAPISGPLTPLHLGA